MRCQDNRLESLNRHSKCIFTHLILYESLSLIITKSQSPFIPLPELVSQTVGRDSTSKIMTKSFYKYTFLNASSLRYRASKLKDQIVFVNISGTVCRIESKFCRNSLLRNAVFVVLID